MQLIEELNGDASTRRYFRFKKDKDTLIKMQYQSTNDAKKQIDNFKYKQSLFKACNINVPNIYKTDLEDLSLFISDLGSVHLADLTESKQPDLYKTIIDNIILYQKPNILFKESFSKDLFFGELVKTYDYCFSDIQDIDKNKYLEIAKKLVNLQVSQDYKLTHRDLHSRNIMIQDDKLFLIDFQDASLGPYTYDIASLFADPYNKYTSKKSVLDLEFLEFLKLYSKSLNYSYDKTLKFYKINSMQRMIKMLGTFEYLNKKQNKPQYIKYIPILLAKINNLFEDNLFKDWEPIIESYSKRLNHC